MARGEVTYNSALRAVHILERLRRSRTGAMSVKQLASDLECSERTIKRYTNALHRDVLTEDAEPIVKLERREGGVPWVVYSRSARSVAGNIYQYAAIHAAVSHLSAVDDNLLGEGAQTVLRRVRENMGKEMRGTKARKLRELVSAVSRGFHYLPFGPKSYAKHDDILDSVVQAIVYRRPLTIGYRKIGVDEPKSYDVEPHTLVMYRDGLYLLASTGTGEDRRKGLYAIDRVVAATLDRTRTLEDDEDFDPEAYFHGGLGIWKTSAEPVEVIVAFTKAAAFGAQERRWPNSHWSEGEDGRLCLHMNVPVTPELITWVLTWGPAVEVLEPAALRAEVATRLADALKHYQ